jgi:fibro-slime domain-containing protein
MPLDSVDALDPPEIFSFTSEIHYWFKYDKTKSYTFDFVGDDDVWVFINRTLAVDLGGVHTPVDGKIVIGADGNGVTTVTRLTLRRLLPLPQSSLRNSVWKTAGSTRSRSSRLSVSRIHRLSRSP